MKTIPIKLNRLYQLISINQFYKYSSFKDAVKLFILIILLIFVIYKSPEFIKLSSLLLLLFLFFYSKPKNDYFWIIIALVLVDNPWNLFWLTTDDVFKMGIVRLSYLQVFSLLSFVKVLNKQRYPPFSSFLKKPFQIYLVFLFIVIINGLIIGAGQTGPRYLFYISKIIIILPLFYSLPIMLYDESSLLKFFNLIFILIIFNFAGQVYSVLTRQNIHFLLGGAVPKDWDTSIYYSKADLVRPTFGALINLLGYIASFFFLFSRLIYFRKKYLISIGIISFFSILITATRGWFIAFLIFLIMVLINAMKSGYFKYIIKKAILILIPAIIIITLNNKILNQFNDVFKRLGTIELLYKGDETLGGTNSRLTDRSLPVMTKFYEKPLFGWGISGVGIATSDGHVGNQSMLMIGGILGYCAVVGILIYFILKLYILSIKLDNDDIK